MGDKAVFGRYVITCDRVLSVTLVLALCTL